MLHLFRAWCTIWPNDILRPACAVRRQHIRRILGRDFDGHRRGSGCRSADRCRRRTEPGHRQASRGGGKGRLGGLTLDGGLGLGSGGPPGPGRPRSGSSPPSPRQSFPAQQAPGKQAQPPPPEVRHPPHRRACPSQHRCRRGRGTRARECAQDRSEGALASRPLLQRVVIGAGRHHVPVGLRRGRLKRGGDRIHGLDLRRS